MSTTKEQIEKDIAELTYKLETSKKTLEELKRNDVTNCKPGDYVMCVDDSYEKCDPKRIKKGNIYLFHSISQREYIQINEGGSENGWWLHQFRPATISEIDSYLINEAAKLGFIVGAKVHCEYWNQDYLISNLYIYRGQSKHPLPGKDFSYYVQQEYNNTKKPFVFACYNNGEYGRPINQLRLVPNLPDITIMVDGTVYTAEFHPNYVQFGCARISNKLFIDACDFLNTTVDNIGQNKFVTNIQIGKGLFSPKLIKQIATRIKEGK